MPGRSWSNVPVGSAMKKGLLVDRVVPGKDGGVPRTGGHLASGTFGLTFGGAVVVVVVVVVVEGFGAVVVVGLGGRSVVASNTGGVVVVVAVVVGGGVVVVVLLNSRFCKCVMVEVFAYCAMPLPWPPTTTTGGSTLEVGIVPIKTTD